MIGIYLTKVNQDENLLAVIKGIIKEGEEKVGLTETFNDGLQFLKNNYPEEFRNNKWILRKI